MKPKLWIIWAVGSSILFIAMTGCSGDKSPAQSSHRSAASPSSTAITGPAEVSHSKLPGIQSLKKARAVQINETPNIDWTLVAYGKAWVKGVGKGIGIFDAKTGHPLGSVRVEQGPCAAMDAAFGSIWTATCFTPGVARIDARTGRLTGFTKTADFDSESTIGAGEKGVWIVTNGKRCMGCLVVRIDPKTMKISNRFHVPDRATAVRAGAGGVWVTYNSNDTVLHLDPRTGAVVATIPVGEGPRFFDVGDGGVWVMGQSDGSLCHINASDDSLVGCSVIDRNGVAGGDLTVGDGYVWFRGSAELVTQIDARTGKVVRRIGRPEGSGSASAGSGELWITAHDVAHIYRVPEH